MANGRGGGGVSFIPPEFFGLVGLGQGMKGLGQGLQERNRIKREQEEKEKLRAERAEDRALKGRQVATAEEVARANIGSQNFRDLITGLKEGGASMDTIRGAVEATNRLPEGFEMEPGVESLQEGISIGALQRADSEGFDSLNDFERMLAGEALFGDPLTEERRQGLLAETDFRRLQEDALGTEMERSAAADEGANAFLEAVAPEFRNAGMQGLKAWATMSGIQIDSAMAQAQIRALGARAGLDEAQLEAMSQRALELGQAGNSFATDMIGMVGGLPGISEDLITRFVSNPDSLEDGPLKSTLSDAAAKIRADAEAAAEQVVRGNQSEEADKAWERVENLGELVSATTDEAQKKEFISTLNAASAEYLNLVYPGVATPQTTEDPFGFWRPPRAIEPTFEGTRGVEINEEALDPIAAAMLRGAGRDSTRIPGDQEQAESQATSRENIQQLFEQGLARQGGNLDNMITVLEAMEPQTDVGRQQTEAVLEMAREQLAVGGGGEAGPDQGEVLRDLTAMDPEHIRAEIEELKDQEAKMRTDPRAAGTVEETRQARMTIARNLQRLQVLLDSVEAQGGGGGEPPGNRPGSGSERVELPGRVDIPNRIESLGVQHLRRLIGSLETAMAQGSGEHMSAGRVAETKALLDRAKAALRERTGG